MLPYIREECQEAPGIPTMDANLVQAYLRMLTAFVSEAHQLVPEGEGKAVKGEEEALKLVKIYTAPRTSLERAVLKGVSRIFNDF